MKKIILILLSYFFFSCSSPNKIIQNFIIENQNYNTNKNNALIKEKIIFENTMACFINLTPKPKTVETLNTYKFLEKHYGNKYIELWRKNDFKKINFDIIPNDSLEDYKHNKNNQEKVNTSNLYFISKPYFYKEKKIQFLYFNVIFYKNLFSRNPIYNDAVILKKINNKWVVIERRANSNL